MADVEAGRIDCIVVYKIDRLSRSLLDFAKIMEVLDRRSISLVSVTQQFNTTTSMGRLTLNILLSFAQFEREIISERTRDKIASARRKGKWTGSPLSLAMIAFATTRARGCWSTRRKPPGCGPSSRSTSNAHAKDHPDHQRGLRKDNDHERATDAKRPGKPPAEFD